MQTLWKCPICGGFSCYYKPLEGIEGEEEAEGKFFVKCQNPNAFIEKEGIVRNEGYFIVDGGLIEWENEDLSLVNGLELLSTDYEQVEIIGDGILAPGRLVQILAPPKTGKTLLALDIAMHILDPKKKMWLDFPLEKEVNKIIYLTGEGGPQMMKDRLNKKENKHVADKIEFWWPKGKKKYKLNEPETLIEAVKRAGADILIVDPAVKFHVKDENSTKEMAQLCEHLMDIREETGVAIVLVHHTRKSGTNSKAGSAQEGRGSSVLHGEVDTSLVLGKSGDKINLDFELRWAENPDTFQLEIQKDLSFKITKIFSRGKGNQKTNADEILEVLTNSEEEWLTTTEIAKIVDVKQNKTVKRYLDKLLEEGRVITKEGAKNNLLYKAS